MSFVTHDALVCPLDQQPLQLESRSLRCSEGHSFDIARQGYANLLGAGDKRSRDPGDSREMVAARRDFLQAGYYRPLSEQLNHIVLESLDGLTAATLVDAGCGEGYYLQRLHAACVNAGTTGLRIVGFDISKWAMQVAARRLDATWLVASNRHIPLQDDSADLVLSLFGFPDYGEFLRILRPGGRLLLVEPGPQHLLQLRELIYEEVRSSHSTQRQRALAAGFSALQQLPLRCEIELPHPEAIAQLLRMTPHLYRASAEGRARTAALQTLPLQLDVNYEVLQAPL